MDENKNPDEQRKNNNSRGARTRQRIWWWWCCWLGRQHQQRRRHCDHLTMSTDQPYTQYTQRHSRAWIKKSKKIFSKAFYLFIQLTVVASFCLFSCAYNSYYIQIHLNKTIFLYHFIHHLYALLRVIVLLVLVLFLFCFCYC